MFFDYVVGATLTRTTSIFMLQRSVAFFSLGLGGLIVAILDREAECQKGTRAGLTLSDYLLGQSIWAFIQLLLILAVTVTYEASTTNHGTFYDDIFYFFRFTYAVSEFARWIFWIVGVVVLWTDENRDCVTEGTRLGVFTLISLVFLVPLPRSQ